MDFVERLTRYLLPNQDALDQVAGSEARNVELSRQVAGSEARNVELSRQLALSEARNAELSRQLAAAQARVHLLEEPQMLPPLVDVNVLPMIPRIPNDQRTPTVIRLLEIVHLLREQLQVLRDEIARLKGLKAKPKVSPSKLTGSTRGDNKNSGDSPKKPGKGKRAGSEKREKTAELTIHETLVVDVKNVPEGSRFKGYEDFTVQDIIIKHHNTLYRVERWESPSGETFMGMLPEHLKGGHFGPNLIAYILYQYHHAHVTQPLLYEQLREFGIDISTGKLSQILTEGKEDFHAEKDALLAAGLAVSKYVHVDDTTARHQGNNGYCTHIGNELFAYFESTESKSRINFLQLLRGPHTDYMLNEDAFGYMKEHKLPEKPLGMLTTLEQTTFADDIQWSAVLLQLKITDPRHIQTATEGALVGSILAHGFNEELVIISDDAGQFDVFRHGLCWVHAERLLARLVGFDDAQRADLQKVRSRLWEFYRELKAYKEAPTPACKQKLEAGFDELMSTKTCFASLNQALKRLRRNKGELLLVLSRPEIALENNLSERDIREYVKKRKISGSTRSKQGRRCRDTFASLKKTCRKHGVSFWLYLKDRLMSGGTFPNLSELIRQGARQSRTHGLEQQLHVREVA